MEKGSTRFSGLGIAIIVFVTQTFSKKTKELGKLVNSLVYLFTSVVMSPLKSVDRIIENPTSFRTYTNPICYLHFLLIIDPLFEEIKKYLFKHFSFSENPLTKRLY